MLRKSAILLMLVLRMALSSNKTDEKEDQLIVQQFFDFGKEVENFITTEEDYTISTNSTPSLSNNFTLYLEPGILAERDYDFYEDDLIDDTSDSETAESAVRAGVYSQHADRRNTGDYDYEYEVEQRDYGHGHSSGHEGSYGGGHDSGYKVQPKKPGPYGYATDNFKCEKSSETLYVTKTEWTFDKKCFNVYKVKCTEGYDEGKVK